jgi:lysophospholipase L1-like esterase
MVLAFAAIRLGSKVLERLSPPRPVPVAHPLKPGASRLTLLCLGQSNAASHGFPRARAGSGVFAFWEGAFYEPADPWPGTSGSGGSVWSRLGSRIRSSFQVEEVVIAAIAQGSTRAEDWAPGGVHEFRTQQALSALAAQDLDPDWIIWHQGESDALDTERRPGQYRQDVSRLIASLRAAGSSSPILVCLATRHGDSGPSEELRREQRSVWDALHGVYAGVDTDSFGKDLRSDGVHFNAKGLALFADGLVRAMHVKSDQKAVSLEDLP